MKHLIVLLLSFNFSNPALAKQLVERGCSLRANVAGLDAAVLKGAAIMIGEGTLVCKNPETGHMEYQQVGIALGGAGLHRELALPSFQPAALTIEVINPSVTRHDSMHGEYALDRDLKLRQLSERAGMDAGVAASARDGRGWGVRVKVKLQNRESFGLGEEFAFSGMTVMPIREFEAQRQRQQMARLEAELQN